jgi:hypothetical protein
MPGKKYTPAEVRKMVKKKQQQRVPALKPIKGTKPKDPTWAKRVTKKK